MSKRDEAKVASTIAAELGVRFEPASLQLGSWGIVDGHCRIGGWRLVLEVESSQKHPTTNVAKLWPWLEERAAERVLLVHAFLPASPGLKSNRGRIAEWLGARMEKELKGRFLYVRIVEGNAGDLAKLQAVVVRLNDRRGPGRTP